MKFKNSNNFQLITLFVVLFYFAFLLPVHALTLSDLFGRREADIEPTIGLGNSDLYQIIISLISVVLGFVGIVMVIMVMTAGFKWMLSGGNEDKIREAKATLVSTIIGLIIILSAWAVVQFIINSLLSATGAV